MQHLPSYLGFSYLGCGVISSRLLQQSAAAAPYLDEGYLLTATLPDLQCGIAPLGPPVPVQPLLLGHGVAPPSLCPWARACGCSSRQPYPPPPRPRAWGFSSRPPPRPRMRVDSSGPPLTFDTGWLFLAAPDLCFCAVTAWHSRPLPLTSDMG